MTETTIFGLDTPRQRCDELLHLFVRREWLSYEGALFGSKWFDYRFLHPVQATYLYAHHFVAIYRRLFREMIDFRAAEHIKPLRHEDLFACDKAIVSAIWRGRQHADAMGVPYEVYIELAMRHMLRFWNRKHLPRPAQLYSGEACEAVAQGWEQRLESRAWHGEHRAYRLDHYAGLPMQDDHHEFLLGVAAKRDNPYPLLALYAENELLPDEKITMRFGQNALNRVALVA